MKRYSLVFAVLGLLLMFATVANASFPLLPSCSTATFTMKQGYYQGALVWFICTDTNDINFASTMQYPYRILTLAPLLSSAYDPTTTPTGSKMFINVSAQQGPVFTAVPTQANYSGIWSVVFVKFKPGQAYTITNTDPYNAITNPTGLPSIAQADYLATYGTSRSPVVLDCPIVAVGPLDSGIWQRDNTDPTTLYRLPQVITFNKYYKTVTLPAWYTYCQERYPGTPPAKFYIDIATVIVPDVANPVLAARLGANLAPALDLIDPLNAQKFYYVDGWKFGSGSFITGGPPGPFAAVNQYPVIQYCPDGLGVNNRNYGYTPVMDFEILEGGPMFPTGALVFVNNSSYIENTLLTGGVYIDIPDQRINAPVVDFFRITLRPGCGCP